MRLMSSRLESMKQFLDLPEDEANALRIRELDEQYEEDLQRLYTAQAEEYMDDAEDRYYSLDENVLPNPDIEVGGSISERQHLSLWW
jgi:hypothetical protein